jgi:hypothetical protein
MGTANFLMPAFADYLSAFDDDTAYCWIGLDQTDSPLGQL